ncbi:hypothetical protein [Spiroplasma endosymbiont of Panzeria rudis]|uniref:hypothetical protein n=1 Tax=Spiroplasma endosymbiont of Panzeria rudis TaxID=3066301 RepID=UPI0030CADDDE
MWNEDDEKICDWCNHLVYNYDKFQKYYFCSSCFKNAVAEVKLQKLEKKGLTFKFKYERNNYLKMLKKETPKYTDQVWLKKVGKNCYICKKRYLPIEVISLSDNVNICEEKCENKKISKELFDEIITKAKK